MRAKYFVSLITCATFLGACGGGGGDGTNDQGGSTPAEVPTQATHTLSDNEGEASALASNTISSSEKTAQTSAAQSRLTSISALSGNGPTGNEASTKHALQLTRVAKNIASKESYDLNCADFAGRGGTIGSCTGTVRLESNLDENSVDAQGNIRAGSFVQMTFNDFSYDSPEDGVVALSGTIRVTFETSYTTSPLAGVVMYQATNLSGISQGQAFGPENATYRISLADGSTTIIANDTRIQGLEISTTDAGNFVISGGSSISGYGQGYIEVDYTNWRVVDGIPQPGSSVLVRGTNGTASVVVSSVDNNLVTIEVTMSIDGSGTTYIIVVDSQTGQTTIL